MRRVVLLCTVFLGLWAAAAGQQAFTPTGDKVERPSQNGTPLDPNWKVPEQAGQKKNPLTDKPELAAGGKKVFAKTCAMCHGDEAHQRKTRVPDLSSSDVQEQSDGALFWRMSNGNAKTGMPSFAGLPEPQRWQLVMYIRSLKH